MDSEVMETDVLVIGTGAAGLMAAHAAHTAGARVALVEKTDTVGGTSAVSGGVLWIPNNPHMAAAGIEDSAPEATEYIRRLADGRADAALIAAFVANSPEMLAFVEHSTALRFKTLLPYADYHAEFAGGKASGRSLDPGLFDTRELGRWQSVLRKSPVLGGFPISVSEFLQWQVVARPQAVPVDIVTRRNADGWVGYGGALVGGLFKAVLDDGIEPQLEMRVRELHQDAGLVVGAHAERRGQTVRLRARRGVVLASGGFEWDPALCTQFLGGPLTHPTSPPSNEGDGLRMLMTAGVALANMNEAWWCPAIEVPGEWYDGAPFYRGEFSMRSLPHSLIVNRRGQRFVNEAANYHDLTKSFFTFDPTAYERPNLPAWLVFDSRYAQQYSVVSSFPGTDPPAWILRGDTLPALAHRAGIAADGLVATVDRFNAFARSGEDPEFLRGGALCDRVYCDPERQPNPTLGPLERPPYFALRLHPGALGTKGGARVNRHAQVLRPNGEVLPGLYAVGNVMASFAGAGYPGAGATLAGAMTFGFIAGRHAAAQRLPESSSTSTTRRRP